MDVSLPSILVCHGDGVVCGAFVHMGYKYELYMFVCCATYKVDCLVCVCTLLLSLERIYSFPAPTVSLFLSLGLFSPPHPFPFPSLTHHTHEQKHGRVIDKVGRFGGDTVSFLLVHFICYTYGCQRFEYFMSFSIFFGVDGFFFFFRFTYLHAFLY